MGINGNGLESTLKVVNRLLETEFNGQKQLKQGLQNPAQSQLVAAELDQRALDGLELSELMVEVVRRVAEAECLNFKLEQRVTERTAELQALNTRLINEIAERKQMEAELAELQHRLAESREAERLYLAQELHDGPLQELHGLVFKLAELEPTLSTEASLGRLTAAQASLQQVIKTVRSICGELRPPALAPFGLARAIRSHAQNFQKRNPDLKIELDLTADYQLLPEQMRLALFRIYQHALSNVIRHAAANQVTIRFQLEAEQVLLEIEDDGCGFNLPRRWIELARQGHLGLVGSAERAEALGGRMTIDSTPGSGTLLQVTIPRLEKQAAEKQSLVTRTNGRKLT